MTESNGTSVTMAWREYRCSGCGIVLFETNIPMPVLADSSDQIRLTCPDRRCQKRQAPHVGQPPHPRINRAEWLANRQPRAVSLDRLKLGG